MLTALLLLVCWAFATTVEVNFCALVDIEYIDTEAGAGDRWTSDTDKPARGFYYVIQRNVLPTPTFVQSGYLEDSGTDAGCTGNVTLQQGGTYKFLVSSFAIAAGNSVTSYNDSSNLDIVSDYALTLYYAASNDTVNAVLPYHDEYNYLALVTFALVMHDGNMNETYVIYNEPGCGGYCSVESGNWMKVGPTNRKYIVAHELGHLVSMFKDAGGNGCNGTPLASIDNCDGQSNQLTKVYQSTAACQGVADFYSALTWNQLTAGGAEDCIYRRQSSLDWNEDGAFDMTSADYHACHGDPWDPVAGADPDGVDWLEDMVVQTDGGTDGECGGTLTNRGTQYDWLTYLWDMVAVQGVPLGDLWEIWDEADPHDWVADDSGTTGDFPADRMDYWADQNGYGAEEDAADNHGVDH